jgi:hypothetical protein
VNRILPESADEQRVLYLDIDQRFLHNQRLLSTSTMPDPPHPDE